MSVYQRVLLTNIAVTAGLFFSFGCNRSQSKPSPTIVVVQGAEVPRPTQGGQVVVSGPMPTLDDLKGEEFIIPGTQTIVPVMKVGGVPYVPVDGLLTNGSFAAIQGAAVMASLGPEQKRAVMQHEVDATLKVLREKAMVMGAASEPEVGYFSAWIPAAQLNDGMSKVNGLLPQHVVMNLRGYNRIAIEGLKTQGHIAPAKNPGDGRSDSEGFSGLERMGVPEFLEKVSADLGQIPDGSSVKVGITDTGITYAHPAFTDAKGISRIQYMKDFTGEGRLYFDPAARFDVTIPAQADQAETLRVNAQVIVSPVTAVTPPQAGVYTELKDAALLVGPELRAILTTPGNGARLAAFRELAFAERGSPENGIDLNHNQKTDDTLYALMVPGQKGAVDQVYFSMVPDSLDFRFSKPLRDFNSTGDTIEVFAERWGLAIGQEKLPGSADTAEPARTASIVGFDPGDHGTHVAGIIGARKTIANDDDKTLARGAAPGAQLMMNRVCSQSRGCYSAQAIVDLAKSGAQIINMSLGGLQLTSDGYDVQSILVDRLTSVYNVLFIISAGNSGPIMQTVGDPSTARLALSVGATGTRSMITRQYQWESSGKPDRAQETDVETDFVMDFSSRGPTAAGGFKPNITAPGTELSAQPFNNNIGLNVMAGTSMASPSAAGAAALLLDAIHRHNAKASPQRQMPTDALTLARIIQSSARPFDVNTYDPESGEIRQGQYTWIDQGNGMINLPQAWKMLQHLAANPIAPSITAPDDKGVEQPVVLDYEVRTRFVNRHKIAYDGSVTANDRDIEGLDTNLTQEAVDLKYGRGLWIDYNGTRAIYSARINRSLPFSLSKRADARELTRRLESTVDKFKIVTVIHGSSVPWLKAGTLLSQDCSQSQVTPYHTVVGPGVNQASILLACVDRTQVSKLPPGDHGALIYGYRVDERDNVEAHASFIVPVYLTVPHFDIKKVVSVGRDGSSTVLPGYELKGVVPAYGVRRNYIEVPAGVVLMNIRVELPPAVIVDGMRQNCGGAALSISRGGPLDLPEDSPSVSTCNPVGEDINSMPTGMISESNPTPGVWEVHVGGHWAFRGSAYTLKVDFVQVEASRSEITGTASALSGDLELTLRRSLDLLPVAEKSELVLEWLTSQRTVASVGHKATIALTDSAKLSTFQYPSTIMEVKVETFHTDRTIDVDLKIMECADATVSSPCQEVASSAGPDSYESAKFIPRSDRVYRYEVEGFDTKGVPAAIFYTISERYAAESTGVTIDALSDNSYKVSYAMGTDQSRILQLPRFISGQAVAEGQLIVKTATLETVARIPVRIFGTDAAMLLDKALTDITTHPSP